MEIVIQQNRETVKTQMSDILLDISWANLSRKYFGKSRSWLYHKLDGIKGDGSPDEFSQKEKEDLKLALNDLAERIQKAAENI